MHLSKIKRQKSICMIEIGATEQLTTSGPPKVSYCQKQSTNTNSVGIAMDHRLNGRGSIPGRSKRMFCISKHPEWLWDPLNLLSSDYGVGGRAFSLWVKLRGAKLATVLYLVPRLRIVDLYLRSLTFLDGIALNWLSTGTSVPIHRDKDRSHPFIQLLVGPWQMFPAVT
jgi:hypothetical protein